MTDHPCKGMGPAAIAAFERIAVNQPPYATERTLNALERRDLVERETRYLNDTLGRLSYAVFTVPLPVHMQWCEWCSENVPDDELPSS